MLLSLLVEAAAGGGDPIGGDVLKVKGLGRGLVIGGLVLDERMCEGVVSGGNKILCEISGTWGFLERTNGAPVSPLELVSERDDRTS